ncbi:MAG: hypothetical protein HRT51_19830 [Colwellia sp.]|nr:hypothetical protein [Colwellia sp.]
MTSNFDWLDRLNRDSKGIWGVSTQLNSKRGGQCVSDSSPVDCETEDIHIVNIDGVTKFQSSSHNTTDMNLKRLAESALISANEFERSFVRIVIHDFHIANAEEQCFLIKESRAIQETSSRTSFQFVFCGQWSYFSFCKSYYELHGKTSSPAAEYKNILSVPQVSLKDVKLLLLQKNLISSQVTEIEKIACEFLIECTSGNEFITDKAIEYISDSDGTLVESIEQVIDELMVSPDVIKYVNDGVRILDKESKSELSKLLQVHRLIRNKDSSITECLWVAGLVRSTNLTGNKHQVQIAGPIINTVLRNIATSVGLRSCAPAKYLCLESNVISAQVYRKVAEIENLFRCLVVSGWYEELGENWQDNLQKVKTPAHSKSENEELINLVLKCIKQEFPQLASPDSNNDDLLDKPKSSSRRKPKQEGILDSAKNWQSRQNNHHGVELGKNNLMHFLTTAELKNVLTSKYSGMVGEDKIFTKKEFLLTTLDEYLAIRSAVAHNQPIMLATISRLDVLLRKITDWISVFIDKELVNSN